jgi:hypothetical protein
MSAVVRIYHTALWHRSPFSEEDMFPVAPNGPLTRSMGPLKAADRNVLCADLWLPNLPYFFFEEGRWREVPDERPLSSDTFCKLRDMVSSAQACEWKWKV